MSSPAYKEVFKTIQSLKATNGTMLIENRKLRPFSENEYLIFSKQLNFGLNTESLTESSKKQIVGKEYTLYLEAVKKFTGKKLDPKIKKRIIEAVKISDFRVTTSLLLEDDSVYDKKIKNPETGRTIKVATAIQDKQHPAHDKAKAMVQKAGGSDDEHGDDHGHGDGHDEHHESKFSKRTQIGIAAAEVIVKAAHVPGLDKIAGRAEKIAEKLTENPFDEVKKAKGFINKAKAFGKASKQTVSKWKDDVQQGFANSLTDEATGERKSFGKVMGDKMKAVAKASAGAIAGEVKHIKLGFVAGGQGVKEAFNHPDGLKAGLKDPDIQKKLTKGVVAAAHTGLIAMAAGLSVGTGGTAGIATKGAMYAIKGLAVKGGVIAATDEKVWKGLVTASVYIELGNRSMLNELHKNRIQIMRLIENKVENIGVDDFNNIYYDFGSKELNEVEQPTETYSEDEMDIVVKTADEGIVITENFEKARKESEATKSGKEE